MPRLTLLFGKTAIRHLSVRSRWRRKLTLLSDPYAIRAKVCLGKRAQNRKNPHVRIKFRTTRLDLLHRISTPTQKRSIGAEVRFQNCGQPGFAVHVERTVRGEITERISNQLAFVDFHPTDHMRTAAQNKLRAGINRGMSKAAQVAAILAQERLCSLRNMLAGNAFRTAVERH